MVGKTQKLGVDVELAQLGSVWLELARYPNGSARQQARASSLSSRARGERRSRRARGGGEKLDGGGNELELAGDHRDREELDGGGDELDAAPPALGGDELELAGGVWCWIAGGEAEIGDGGRSISRRRQAWGIGGDRRRRALDLPSVAGAGRGEEETGGGERWWGRGGDRRQRVLDLPGGGGGG
uniref:Expressed protein n=1 Tax=Oryza sativa subsp. japonica TaxID=39947 RepID=Q10RP8_ORYSJ|nr:expressed protein [Oryza sativa Japonica Group]